MNKKLRKEIIEWVLLIGFLLILFYTPLGTTISTTLQRGLLATGLIRPDISEKEEAVIADFNFELMDINGNSVPFSTFQGKVIFVNFWATWCAPCIAEMPDINELHQIFEQDENIKFVLISVDRDFEKAQRFMKEKSFNLPLYRLKTGLPDVYKHLFHSYNLCDQSGG